MARPLHLGLQVRDLGVQDRGEVLVLARACRDSLDMGVANVVKVVEAPMPSVLSVAFASTMSSTRLVTSS